jgi:hypothetical protein
MADGASIEETLAWLFPSDETPEIERQEQEIGV